MRFVDERFTRACSSLTLGTLFALVPLMAMSLALIQIMPVFAPIVEAVQDFLFNNFVPSTSDEIQTSLSNFAHQASKLTWFGSIFITVTVFLLMLNVESIINDIWFGLADKHVWYLRWAKHASIIILFPLLMTVSITLSSYFLKNSMTTVVHLVLPFFVTFIAITFLYKFVPNCKVPWRSVLWGAGVAAIAFEVMKMGFKLYLAYFSTYQILYGALSIFPILVLWLYLSWAIVLYGSLLASEVTSHIKQR